MFKLLAGAVVCVLILVTAIRFYEPGKNPEQTDVVVEHEGTTEVSSPVSSGQSQSDTLNKDSLSQSPDSTNGEVADVIQETQEATTTTDQKQDSLAENSSSNLTSDSGELKSAAFPNIQKDNQTGHYSITDNYVSNMPKLSSSKVLISGTGPMLSAGDRVAIRYDMLRLSNGQRVESTGYEDGQHLVLTAGAGDSNRRVAPPFVYEAIKDARVGDVLQVVFGRDMLFEISPDHPKDGYLLVVTIEDIVHE